MKIENFKTVQRFSVTCLGEGYIKLHRQIFFPLYLDLQLYLLHKESFFHSGYVITHLLTISVLTVIHSLHWVPCKRWISISSRSWWRIQNDISGVPKTDILM